MRSVRSFVTFFHLYFIKLLANLFYRFEVSWVENGLEKNWKDVHLFVFLNHTSLFEPLFLGALPTSYIWEASPYLVVPAADKTMERPILGRFLTYSFNAKSISRKRDDTWLRFMKKIEPRSMIGIAPEGRMMRADGLDRDGKPMSIRGGIADVISRLNEGFMVVAYSGGLHHVQVPGEKIPRLFKTIKMRFERLSIEEYKKSQFSVDHRQVKINIVTDLEERKKLNTPG